MAGGWSLHKSRDKIYVRGVNNHEFFCAITLEEAVCEEKDEAWKHGRAGTKHCLYIIRLSDLINYSIRKLWNTLKYIFK